MKGYIETLGRFVVGAMIGVTFAAGIASGQNWIVTSQTMHEKVTGAKVAVLSEVCEQRAHRYWTVEENRPAAKLGGWGNQKRINLAERFATEMVERSHLRGSVIQTCNEALRPA